MEYLASLFPFMMEGTVVTLKIFFISLLRHYRWGRVCHDPPFQISPSKCSHSVLYLAFPGYSYCCSCCSYILASIIGINIDRFPAALLPLSSITHLAEVYAPAFNQLTGDSSRRLTCWVEPLANLSRIILRR